MRQSIAKYQLVKKKKGCFGGTCHLFITQYQNLHFIFFVLYTFSGMGDNCSAFCNFPLEFVWCNESVQALLDFQMAVQISDDLSSRGFMEKEKKTETGLIFGEKIQIAQKI